ncbi:MAG: Pyridoxine 5'-phosphate synthase [candidate division BRC1 bacterium ADurb.BinA364]|nr:MAG: Pyridoxine 5'-phosphate synthase [candidate division BRC1 bacterium ADurb.BinA364]
MIRLSVNLNKIATVRNARGGDNPSVVQAGRVAVEAGCHGLTVHPRPDGRHIRRRDVFDVAALLRESAYAGRDLEFNIEGYPSAEYLELVLEIRPAQATLVPDPPEALTSNAGWNLLAMDGARQAWLRSVIRRLQSAGIRVSLFLEPVIAQVRRAAEIGADRIELYTEAYAKAYATPDREAVYEPYRRAALEARQAGLGLNAGHDLDLRNLGFFAAETPGLLEVSIGHALICDALYMGLASAVRAYLKALERAG